MKVNIAHELISDLRMSSDFLLFYRWGVEHEKVARDEYCDAVKHSHEEFQIKESGLHLHAAYPHLGASPDGIVSCCCCGHGVCEIKVCRAFPSIIQ